MKSSEIQEQICEWAVNKNFNAPYGVLTGEYKNSKGKKYKSVTFGRTRTLDACVDIYNENFMILKVNQRQNQVFKSVEELWEALEEL